jgi:hypothetical protein
MNKKTKINTCKTKIDDLFISFPDPKDRMSFLPSLAGHSTHFQVGGENQKVDPSGVVGGKTRTRGPNPAENELKDFRGKLKLIHARLKMNKKTKINTCKTENEQEN